MSRYHCLASDLSDLCVKGSPSLLENCLKKEAGNEIACCLQVLVLTRPQSSARSIATVSCQ